MTHNTNGFIADSIGPDGLVDEGAAATALSVAVYRGLLSTAEAGELLDACMAHNDAVWDARYAVEHDDSRDDRPCWMLAVMRIVALLVGAVGTVVPLLVL